MSYSIRYQSPIRKHLDTPVQKKRKHRIFFFTVIFLLIIGSYNALREYPPLISFLVPGADAYTGEAFQTMLENIKDGQPVTEAFAACCTDIIKHAKY